MNQRMAGDLAQQYIPPVVMADRCILSRCIPKLDVLQNAAASPNLILTEPAGCRNAFTLHFSPHSSRSPPKPEFPRPCRPRQADLKRRWRHPNRNTVLDFNLSGRTGETSLLAYVMTTPPSFDRHNRTPTSTLGSLHQLQPPSTTVQHHQPSTSSVVPIQPMPQPL
jgi:hypothetical protein